MVYNASMNTPTLTLKAKRIVSVMDGDHENGMRIHIALFRPSVASIKAVAKMENEPEIFIELDDETGQWANDRKVAITEFVVSEDGKAARLSAELV